MGDTTDPGAAGAHDTVVVQVSRAVMDAIEAHARSEDPRECCGLLVGSSTRVTEARGLTNAAADPLRRYEISPADYFSEIKRCRERGDVAVVGAYHSHPRGRPEPSPTDREHAFAGFYFLIVGPVSRDEPLRARMYELRGTTFASVTFAVT